jgi:hypothetical protein
LPVEQSKQRSRNPAWRKISLICDHRVHAANPLITLNRIPQTVKAFRLKNDVIVKEPNEWLGCQSYSLASLNRRPKPVGASPNQLTLWAYRCRPFFQSQTRLIVSGSIYYNQFCRKITLLS